MKNRKKSAAYPIGLTITGIRPLTAEEGWGDEGNTCTAIAIDLSDGSTLCAACDQERNGPGVISGWNRDAELIQFYTDDEGTVTLYVG